MRLNKTMVAMGLVAVLCGCQQQVASQDAASGDTPAAAMAAVEGDDVEIHEDGAAVPGPIKEADLVKAGVALAATTVVCGVATPGEMEAGLAKMKLEAASNGVSPSEVDAVYRASLAQIKAAAASNPARFESDCAGLRKMADPAELKKMQEATEKLEKLAAEMEARAAK